MGIDIHGLNLIRYASQRKPLGSTVTLGRQSLAVPTLHARYGPFCEGFLSTQFGAAVVHSYDNSDYEGATFMADFNEPIAPGREYDTVLDFGSAEHIYNIAQALTNISLLCAPGGQILHASPANNFCGHGFWQFSPELFFSLYSERNGYGDTTVFLADLEDERHWYQVLPPANGERAQVVSSSPLYVLCRTVKREGTAHPHVQQSDYVHAWARVLPGPDRTGRMARLKALVRRFPPLYGALLHLRQGRQEYSQRRRMGLSATNPHLKKVSLSELLKT